MESKIIQPKIEIVDSIRLIGHIKATIHRASNGFKPEVVHDEHNTIEAVYLNHLAAMLAANTDRSLADLFTAVATPPTAGKDGIVIKNSIGTEYCMKCTGAAALSGYTLGWTGASASRKLTGEFVGYAVTFNTASNIQMGHGWDITEDWTGASGLQIAEASSWTTLAIASALDYLYIEWTITFA
ncbi:MAG: hypothetical protein KJ556_20710 [Gammaproteobacteria bacterium]|nr:hypothetical protein [Gammaproteobacteria bacterium]